MSPPFHKQPHILILYSDTGGGHRSAAEAISEALCAEYGSRLTVEMVDIFRQYAPVPLNRMPDLYPLMVRIPQAWELGYHLSDGQRRARLFTASLWPYVRKAAQGLVLHHPSDLVVSVHPLASSTVLHALGNRRPPFVIVVTDLVSTHALWYDRRADLCLVPTEPARQRALEQGLAPRRVEVVGLPVADRFCRPRPDRQALLARLGWPAKMPIILLVGGGEGMGPLETIARRIAEVEPPAALVVVAGRNHALRRRLEKETWPIPTRIYGFVREMPDFMHAADILVTKAGPGTISEAFNAGLPLVLYDRLPGQEDGNVSYVVSEGAGVWAPEPSQVVAVIQAWLELPEHREAVAAASRRLARPDSARRIAHLLAQRVNLKT